MLALDDVSLAAHAGSIHALLGENGAGKSTLMHISYGMIRPDGGDVLIGTEGTVHRLGFRSAREARALGIGLVHQHFTSIPAFTVAENIALSAGWSESGAAAVRRARDVVDQLQLPLPVEAYAESLSPQLRQRLEIVKAIAGDARILLLDEPTAVLAPREVEALLDFLRRYAERGNAVVLITHKLNEVLAVADTVTVLRRGVVTLDGPIAGEDARSLARAMVGGEVLERGKSVATAGAVLVRGEHLTIHRAGDSGGSSTPPAIVGASFAFSAGEIIGIAAIDGNGQHELLRAIGGVDATQASSGSLTISGDVAFIPGDRSAESVIGEFTLAENLAFAASADRPFVLDWSALRRETAELIAQHDVRAAGASVLMSTLSGGNQQKFVVARALASSPGVVVAEEPTRGLDIQATAAIHAQLRLAASRGALVVVYSSDLDEVLALADRVVVVARGRVTAMPSTATRDDVGDAMLAI